MESQDFLLKESHAEHNLMLDNVYQDDIELLYLDCCFSELLAQ